MESRMSMMLWSVVWGAAVKLDSMGRSQFEHEPDG